MGVNRNKETGKSAGDDDYKLNISIYINKSVDNKIQEISKKERRSKNNVICEPIDEFIQKTNSEEYYGINVNDAVWPMNLAALIVGAGIKYEDVTECFLDWLEGEETRPISISDASEKIYLDIIKQIESKGKKEDV